MAVIIKDPIFALVNGAGALLTLGFMFIYRKQIKQVARMMKIAADSLAANPGLLPFAVGTNIVVLIPALGFAAALYFLQGNGVRRFPPVPVVASAHRANTAQQHALLCISSLRQVSRTGCQPLSGSQRRPPGH